MTEARVRELMKDKNFIADNDNLIVFYYTQGCVAVVRYDEQAFHVATRHPTKDWWVDEAIDFLNPVAAATYALRHCVTKREVKP
jgi:hypothetical protein